MLCHQDFIVLLFFYYLVLYSTSYSCLFVCCFPSSFCSVLRLIEMGEIITSRELLDNPFSAHPLHDKLRIVNKVRPTPPLPCLITYHKTQAEQYKRHFLISQYGKVDWLAGCETTNKLYCWPCLIFYNKRDVWNKQGFLDLNDLSSAQQKHSKSQTLVHCYLQLKLFGKKHIEMLLGVKCRNVTRNNEQAKKKTVILHRFVDPVCSLANPELLF